MINNNSENFIEDFYNYNELKDKLNGKSGVYVFHFDFNKKLKYVGMASGKRGLKGRILNHHFSAAKSGKKSTLRRKINLGKIGKTIQFGEDMKKLMIDNCKVSFKVLESKNLCVNREKELILNLKKKGYELLNSQHNKG